MENTKITLLDIFEHCLRACPDGVKGELENLFKHAEELDFHEKCLLLFDLGEYTRVFGDHSVIDEYKECIEKMQEEILAQWEKPYRAVAKAEERVYASNAGMTYGSLYNSNLFIKNETISRAIQGMKNFAYDNFTSKGKLVSELRGDYVDVDLLWLCIPFGLFTPEDLVLVESVKEMNPENSYENGLMGWYFAEKADYKQAKVYLSRVGEDDEMAAAMGRIIKTKLIQAGALQDSPIFHRPLGNFNRYQKQNFERNPWFPKDGDEVTVYAALWPAKYPGDVKLFCNDGEKEISVEGIYQEEFENYKFVLGTFAGGAEVSYYIQAGENISEKLEFTVLKKETVKTVLAVKTEGDTCYALLESDAGKKYCMEVLDKGETYQFAVKPAEEIWTEETGSAHMVVCNEELLTIEKNGHSLYLEGLYFWKNREEIFSTGMAVKAEDEEGFYGFGERYNNTNQRGNLVDVYVYNQYKDQGIKTYFPMPYFISSNGYGLYLPTSRYTEFDMCCAKKDTYVIETQMKDFQVECFLGTPKEMIGQFTSLTGKPVMMPEWAFGPWMSSNNWDSEAEVRKQVELTKKYDIPSTVLVIEAWSDEATYYIFNDAVYAENNGAEAFQYDDFKFPEWGRWPDPKGMVEYLHENGLKCILWQIPIIKYINSLHHLQKDKDEAYAIENGYCVKREDGTPYRMPEGWFTDSLLFDFTNREASDWWFAQREYLVKDVKIDGFKTDGGEFVFGDDTQFADGRTGKEMRNEYPNLYIDKYYQYIHEKRDGIVFSRAGFTGAAQMPAHWAGDERSTFSAFKRNLCAGLNAGISGVPFWGWDLGGFSGEIPSAELFVRSTQMATFCPVMQYHAESKAEFNQDRTPWNIAERRNAPWVIDDYRYYAKLRMALIPYIMEQAKVSVETGVPLMRAMFLEFPEDKNVYPLFDQYMFGSELLVAPIVEEGAETRTVYLPEGTWVNIFNGTVFEGGKSYEMHADVHEIPVLKKMDSAWKMEFTGEEFHVYKEEA